MAEVARTVWRRTQRAARHVGLDLRRYPQADPLWHVARLLVEHRVDLVLDVGAHRGKYGAALRRFGYRGRIWSFEPLATPFAELAARAGRDPRWDVTRCAVGDQAGWVTVNVAGNKAASSSVLPMLDRHRQAAPHAAYVAAEDVLVRRLDEVVGGGGRVFLKADVQGYEGRVLDGAAALLASGRVVGLQLELSFVPLYEGGLDWREALDRADKAGMALVRLDPGFTDGSGRMLQADGVFWRG